MGDILSPNKRDIVDRLRRRIQKYRRHQNGCLNRYQPTSGGIHEQQHRDTEHLRQKWLESKAKKPQRSRSRSESNTGEQRQSSTKVKRKSGTTDTHNTTVDTKVCVEEGGQKAKVSAVSGNNKDRGTSLSVSIVQQISTTQQDAPTILTEFHVSSTVQQQSSSGVTQGAPQGGATASSANLTESFLCKQEPLDDSQCSVSSNSSNASLPDLGPLEEIQPEELRQILDICDENSKNDDLINVLDKLVEEDSPTGGLMPDTNKDALLPDRPMDGFSEAPATGNKLVFDGINTEPAANSFYSANGTNRMNDMGAPGVQSTPPYRQATPQPHGGPTPGPVMAPSPLLSDGGPASETLKQMASKHQTQSQSFNPDPLTSNMGPGLPHYPAQQYNTVQGVQQDNMYSYGHQGNMGPRPERSPMPVPQQDAKGLPIGYGGTKPLSHYPTPAVSSTSSLQQLQNQVHSHFGADQGQVTGSQQGKHVQITQTQHMHVSHGNQHMQMSQTQQMHINGRPGAEISLAQQQSFNVAAQEAQQRAPGYMNDSMKMQMMQQQQKVSQQQRQTPSGDSHLPPYMNRPPPDYHNRSYPATSMGTSPLQTMQNMVNHTSQQMPQDSMASGGPKANFPVVPPHSRMSQMNMPQGAQLNGVGPNNMAAYTGSGMPQRFPGYMQGDPMANQGNFPHSAQNRPVKNGASPYTSAIMRGQRPPNVNVGPEGLNISHQRPPGMDWPRQMMPAQGVPRGQGPLPPSQMDAMTRPGIPPGMGIEQYNMYNNQAAMGMSQGGQMMTQQQQQALLQQQQQQQGMAGPPMNNMTQTNRTAMMMQQQRMQMQASGHPINSISMAQSAAMSTMTSAHTPQSAPPGNYPMSQPANSNFPLEFLDNAQTSGPDLFDSVVQNPSSSDFNLIDEILK